MEKYLLIATLLILLSGCGNKPGSNDQQATKADTTQIADMHNAATSLDYQGVYEGTLPAASNPGIKTKLTINKDFTYALQSDYIGEKDGLFNNKGTYTLEGNMLTLKQDDGETFYYQVEEGRIRMLNSDKQPITGPMANDYVLKQTKVL